ncbi:uncharacterized protein GGS22DRAFT_113711 [Annulohypoxylon maeteangense]|uniref:uncharacterized protein n=1 Tax=Annulohypoxylon maeteangense TaxID=1927788 RepID=UPI002008E09B|nr:uncharacterized protein GGS22DRAFT_113711 [Annulohypoxylon maeteangense]KAI0879787.1 hypothetical protein GGS22DRAFT_113711 [Annulohypoxylon maeteangense]
MQITVFISILLSATALAAPVKSCKNTTGNDDATTNAAQGALTGGFGLDANTIAGLTKTFPNAPSAADCASNNLSFGQQRQCIDAGLLDDPSF